MAARNDHVDVGNNGAMPHHAPPILEVVIHREGRYVGANEPLLDLLGYTLDELLRLPFGTISTAGPDATREIWRQYVAGDIALRGGRPGELRAKSGEIVAVHHLGVEQRDAHTYVSRMRVAGRRRIADDAPRALPIVLHEWREAERRLAAMAEDDPERPAAERRVEELRALYQREWNRAASD